MNWAYESAASIVIWFGIYSIAQPLWLWLAPNLKPVKRWKCMTRSISILHALVMATTSIIIVNFYCNQGEILTNYNGHLKYPELIPIVHRLNAVMFGYLVVDGLHLLSAGVEPSWLPGTIHHAVGALSMIMFMKTDSYLFNSLFYALTECSTVYLHLTWFSMKFKSKWGTIVCVLITWIIFGFLRVGGGIRISLLYWQNYDQFKLESWPIYIFGIYGNLILTLLNVYWFVRLSQSIFDRFRAIAFPSATKSA